MKITVAHSPDSDDAFMHYGIASGKVASKEIEFSHLLADIETLNKAAFEGTYEVTAVSFSAYAQLTDKYLLLPHGSSMGDDYGPVVVARRIRGGRHGCGSRRTDDCVSRVANLRPGRHVRDDAVRSDPGRRARG
jgi:predicted solute-binding protein